MIELIGLSKSFGNKPVLKDINMTLKSGDVYGVVGSNGAGKTTLFRCIAGLESHEGIVYSDFKTLKNHIGFLETNPIMMSRMTGWEYLKLLSLARGQEYNNFDDYNIFDLPLREYAQNYSTGMKKKLALNGILLQRNDVYILDEPFSGVDIQSNVIIFEIIKKLRDENKIVLIASHVFATLSQTCDRIFALSQGVIDQVVDPPQFDALNLSMQENFAKDKLNRLKF